MSDVGDMWREEREAYKKRRDTRVKRREASIHWLIINGVEVKTFTDIHVRLNGALDLYLVNGRYHHLPSNTRGSFSNIKRLMERFFPGIQLKD